MDMLPVVGAIAITAVLGTVRWIGHRVSLRALGMVARATRSPRACIDFIRFCA